MGWARLTKSKFIAIKTKKHKLYLFKVFIVLFMRLLIYYLHGLDCHYCREHTSRYLCMGTHRFLPFALCQVFTFILYPCGFDFVLWQ